MKRHSRAKAQLRGIGYTEPERAAGALDFCIMKDCDARCDGEELPEGWTLFSIMRRQSHSPNMMQLHAALCPEHADELLQQLKPIVSTGTAVYDVVGAPEKGHPAN
jgi:hypothetical protein